MVVRQSILGAVKPYRDVGGTGVLTGVTDGLLHMKREEGSHGQGHESGFCSAEDDR